MLPFLVSRHTYKRKKNGKWTSDHVIRVECALLARKFEKNTAKRPKTKTGKSQQFILVSTAGGSGTIPPCVVAAVADNPFASLQVPVVHLSATHSRDP